MQILALLAMEQPVTLSADDIRDEKVRVSSNLPCFYAVPEASEDLVLYCSPVLCLHVLMS